jgi:hypothetical protein
MTTAGRNTGMKRVKMTEWVGVSLETDRDKAAVKGWFAPFCDEMTPVSAQILVEIDTDREKKVRAEMRDDNGSTRQVIRARTKAGWTVTMKPVRAALSKEPNHG